jgi:plastocyanin
MMPRSGSLLVAVVGAAALWLAADAAPAAAPADGVRITIKDFMFSPMQVTTRVGVAVTWVNQDDEVHTVVSDTGLFRSGALDTAMTYTFTFDKPGTYQVICSLHPQMKATIVVE